MLMAIVNMVKAYPYHWEIIILCLQFIGITLWITKREVAGMVVFGASAMVLAIPMFCGILTELLKGY